MLVLTSTFPRSPQGAEPRFVLDLCEALSSRFDFLVLAPHFPGAERESRFGEVRVRRYRYFFDWGERLAYGAGILPNLRANPLLLLVVPFFLLAQIICVARALRSRPVALIHAHWLLPQGGCAVAARAIARKRVPILCTAHGTDVFGLRGPVLEWLLRQMVVRTQAIAAVSAAVAARVGAIARAPVAVSVLPMGVSAPAELPRVTPGTQSLQIAFAGRLIEQKGAALLIEAFCDVAKTFPDCRLVIAGAGPEEGRLRALAEARGLSRSVSFPGPLAHPEVLRLFRESSAAVMPSWLPRAGDSEGLGLTMLEAMAQGCPVVAADMPATRDVIRHGVNGLLFPQGDSGALSERLLELLRDPDRARGLAREAMRTATEGFSWDLAATRYAHAYDRAIAAG